MLDYDNIPVVMTVKDVANILKVGKNAVYDAIRCGRLKAIKIGKSLRVTRPELLVYLEISNAA